MGRFGNLSLHLVDGLCEALDIAARGKVKCHHEVRDFSEINSAFNELAAQNVAGRIILKL